MNGPKLSWPGTASSIIQNIFSAFLKQDEHELNTGGKLCRADGLSILSLNVIEKKFNNKRYPQSTCIGEKLRLYDQLSIDKQASMLGREKKLSTSP